MKMLTVFALCVLVAAATSCTDKPTNQSDKQPVAAAPAAPANAQQPTPTPSTPAKPDPAPVKPTPVVSTPVEPAQPAKPVEPKTPPTPVVAAPPAPAAPVVPAAKVGVLDVPMIDAAPKIDGDLDDAAWAKAASTTTFKTGDGADPSVKTKLLVAQDKDTLYVAIVCTEKGGTDKLTVGFKGHDEDGIWQDDSVELFIDPTNKRQSYYQIIVNSKGATWDVYHAEINAPDASWEPKYKTAVKVGKESWVVEYALPLSIFNRTATSGDTWAFNVLRNAQGPGESIYFSPTGGTAHDPAKFGTLSGIKTTWKDRAVEANKPVNKE